MRNAPLNYVISLALSGLLWLGTGYWVANYLKFNVSLGMDTTVNYFIGVYRIVLAAAAVLGLLICFFWYYYGNRERTAGNLEGAKRVWTLSFFGQMALAVAAVVAIIALFRNAVFTTTQYAIFFAVMSAHTYLFYWLCTLFLSPRTVKYVPWGMR
jgi:predicted histidine transporter YuiF (NhaC family)